MKRKISLLALFVFSGIMIHAQERSLFFSEYIANAWTNVLEIYNPTADTIELEHYSISRNGTFRFDFPGGVLLPYSTWVGCRNEPSNPPDPWVLAVADTSWPAANSIWFLGNNALIQLLKDGKVIDAINGDPRNGTVAGITGALDKKTLMRKPSVLVGDTIWDSSRGTNADDSQWIVSEVFYDDLGKHSVSLPSIPWLTVSTGGNNILPGTTVIDFGGVKVGETVNRDFLLENTDNENDHLLKIKCYDNWFSLSDTILSITKGGQETLGVSFSPIELLSRNSTIEITGTGTTDSLFVFGIKASGIKYGPQDTIRFFVSPDGLDSNSGESVGQPLQTIQEAIDRIAALQRPGTPQLPAIPVTPAGQVIATPSNYGDVIRAHSDALKSPVFLHLMPGYHYLSSAISINRSIGGNIHFVGEWADGASAQIENAILADRDNPYSLKLPADKIPVISGGVPISGWSDTIINGASAWVVKLPDVAKGTWSFNSLYVNGSRAIRPRFPKVGSFRIAAAMPTTAGVTTMFTDRVRVYPGDISPNWRNLTDVVMVHSHRWVAERMNIVSFDASTNVVTLGFIPNQDMNGSHPAHGAGLSAYFCDNVFEECNEQGEWYLDKPTGNLFYIPRQGETKENSEVIAPITTKFFEILGQGSGNGYLWNISFEKIAFMHNNSKSDRKPDTKDYAISAEYTRAFSVKSCFFAHMNEGAIRLGAGNMGAEIATSYFRDLGSAGILMSGSTVESARTAYNNLHDNDFFGYGLYYYTEPAIRVGRPVYSTVEHNYMRFGFYNAVNHQAYASQETSGIGYGYRNIIRKNHIHTVGQGFISDIGGIYTTGPQLETVIEGNLIHDVEARDYSSACIYMDDNSSYYTIKNNIFYGTNDEVFEQKGFGNKNENNVYAFGGTSLVKKGGDNSKGQLPDPFGLGYPRTIYANNIFIQNGGQRFFEGVEEPVSGTVPIERKLNSNYNIFHDYSLGNIQMKTGMSFDQWRSSYGYDPNSQVTDPLFKEPFHENFTLSDSSPAIAMGFQPIDLSDVGPRKEVFIEHNAVWVDYPEKPAKPAFLPSSVGGIHMWITAKDIEGERVAEWKDRTWNRYSMYQYYTDLMPEVNPDGLNGYPTVHFDGARWMSTSHKSLRISGNFAKFDRQDFTIFTVHSSSGDQVLFSKGNPGSPGRLSIGKTQNAMEWGSSGLIGEAGHDFKVRTYARRGEHLYYYENSGMKSSVATGVIDDIGENWVHSYLGKSASSPTGSLVGDIAEIIMYRGRMSEEDRLAIEEYLMGEWGLEKTIGVEEMPVDNFLTVHIYPSPARDYIRVDCHNHPMERIALFDIQGRLRRQIEVNGHEAILELSGLEPGVYTIRVVAREGTIVRKVIKN